MADKFPYEDIVNLSHHVSKKHPQASIQDRAARFSPFAAITGYDDMVQEAARITDERIHLDESLLRVLDERLVNIKVALEQEPESALEVTITHFVADEKKTGGTYTGTTGIIKRIDEYQQAIKLTTGQYIKIEDILDITLH